MTTSEVILNESYNVQLFTDITFDLSSVAAKFHLQLSIMFRKRPRTEIKTRFETVLKCVWEKRAPGKAADNEVTVKVDRMGLAG